MKILHTSDWHLGRILYGKKRYEEFEAFLNWLADTIEQNAIDALLVAGDIFDTTTPSHRAQELYYRFLCRIAGSCCRHVVITAGNHDSPSFLSAPKTLLKVLDVHVMGNAIDPADEVLMLRDQQNQPELIVCAVPYLRDRDIRITEAGESIEDKEQKLINGIRNHYMVVANLAEQMRQGYETQIPIVGMGHLFAAGGHTVDGDGVRELYVGSLAHVTAGIFPPVFNYTALGHLHVPQKVGDSESIRYSGSPLPMGFGEARQQKSLCQVEFQGFSPAVQLLEIPVFQKLERIKGDWKSISRRIQELSNAGSQSWLEVIYEGDEIMSDLQERLEEAIAATSLEVLRVKNNRIIDRVLAKNHDQETLEELNPNDVFERCLALHQIPEDQHPELLRTYQETLTALYEDDRQAE